MESTACTRWLDLVDVIRPDIAAKLRSRASRLLVLSRFATGIREFGDLVGPAYMHGLTLPRRKDERRILVLHEEGGHSNWSTSPAMRTNICLNDLPYGAKRSFSPRCQAARTSGFPRSKSQRHLRVTSRRSACNSLTDGRPQYQ